MDHERLELITSIVACKTAARPVGSQLQIADAEKLGRLLFAAYKGTVDDEGETIEQSIEEAVQTLAGKYGPLIPEASFAMLIDGVMASACIVVERDGPFIAFLATDPKYQGKGFGRALMLQSIQALSDAGRNHARLFVTAANVRALSLYQSLGFRPVGETAITPQGRESSR